MKELEGIRTPFQYDLCFNGSVLTSIKESTAIDGSHFDWKGTHYTLVRTGFLSAHFLQEGEETIASAKRVSPFLFPLSFEVTVNGKEFIFRRKSPFMRAFQIFESQSLVGDVTPDHPFTLNCSAIFPEEMEFPAQSFFIWLAFRMWWNSW